MNGTLNTDRGASLTLKGASLVAYEDVNLSGPVSAEGGRLLAGRSLNFNNGATGSFKASKVYARGGINFNDEISFLDTKVLSGTGVNFNDNKPNLFNEALPVFVLRKAEISWQY